MSAERYYKSGYRPEIKHSSEARERLVKVDRRPRVMEEFSRLKVAFAPDRGSRCVHTVYCKPHAVRKDSLVTPSNRTLFSVGWPPYTNKEQIVELFSRVGHVSAVYLQGEPGPINDSEHGQPQTRTFQVAYIVFASPEELKSTDALYKSKKPIACSVEDIAVGLGRWCARYKSERPSRQLLETAVEEGVREYDRLKEEEEEVQEKLAQPDEEGWITVSRSNRKRRQLEAEEEEGGGKKKRKKKTELVNFYRWQQRETQREHIAELRQKFEEDKRKVAAMKAKRKFKPF